MKAVWGILASLRDFMWSRTTHRSRSNVQWTDCCAPRNVGGLKLVDPKEPLHSMMAKWVIKAMTPCNTAFQTLLLHSLFLVMPQSRGTWLAFLQWILVHKFRAIQGSRVWDRIVKSWRKIVRKVEVRPPSNCDEVLTTSLWWSTFYIGSSFGFS